MAFLPRRAGRRSGLMPKVSLPSSGLGWLMMLVASAIGFLAGYFFLRLVGGRA
jgi:hypothetical protein